MTETSAKPQSRKAPVLDRENTGFAEQKWGNGGMSMTAATAARTSLTLAGAERILDIAQQAAAHSGLTQCLAVTDDSGHLLAFRRMDGAGLVSIEVAIGKARTAAYLRKPSRDFEELIDGGSPAMLSTPGLVPLRGGVPVTIDGVIVGALGVSGATGDLDEQVAHDALHRFLSQVQP